MDTFSKFPHKLEIFSLTLTLFGKCNVGKKVSSKFYIWLSVFVIRKHSTLKSIYPFNSINRFKIIYVTEKVICKIWKFFFP